MSGLSKSHSSQLIFTLVTIVFFLVGCGTPAYFHTLDDGVHQDKKGEIIYKVYFDREGYLYPSRKGANGVIIDDQNFRRGAGNAYLQRYFCTEMDQFREVAKQAGKALDISAKCELYEKAEQGYTRGVRYGESEQQDAWLEQWRQIQENLLEKTALEIKTLLAKKEHLNAELFISIHGYNNSVDSIDGTYALIREKLAEGDYKHQKFIFLDVYWDGFVQEYPLTIWDDAQYTGPVVGARLRKLLKYVEPSRSVRILTHSSGAFVVGSLLGDSRAALPKWRQQDICTKGTSEYDESTCFYKQVMMSDLSKEDDVDQKEYSILRSEDVRVGMIAPATSSCTFAGVPENRCGEGRGILKPSGSIRLIVGQHEDDFANTKLLGLEGYFGVTTLGIRKSSFCEIQRYVKDNNALNDTIDVHRVDFKPEGKEPEAAFLFRADHGLPAYFARSDGAKDFWQLFLGVDGLPTTKTYSTANQCQ